MEETDKGRNLHSKNLIKPGKTGPPKHQLLDFFLHLLPGLMVVDLVQPRPLTCPVISKSEPAVHQMSAGFSVCCFFFPQYSPVSSHEFPSDLGFLFFYMNKKT